ncbi:MAG: 50S ribosomal protein L24 [Flavobacteriales bacterium]|jgi:large subunit ribosomal protein L24|nr:50S ribosomal protein L24 [Flavobacteriales bacterium]
MAKLHVKSGDTVKVLSGEDKGKIGKVTSVNPAKGKAIVEGINMVKKHIKPSATNPQGKIEETEAPIYLSKLMVVDSTGQASRIGRKEGENGKLVRYSKKSGEVLN